MIGAVACFVCYLLGFVLAAILYRPMKHWQEGYGVGYKDGYCDAEESAEDPRAAWCKANCHPGPACPDGYCREVDEALKGGTAK